MPVPLSLRPAIRCAVVLVCLLSFLRLSAAEPTYAEWRAACAKLPNNRTLGGRLPPRELLPLQTFDEVTRALNAFYAVATNGPMGQPASWQGTAPRRETFFNVSRSWFQPPEIPFEPFVEKLVLPSTAKVFLQGDLHGDIHSMLAVLDRLNEKKLLDGFTIRDPDLHVIFLGDYTDRGSYGVEVIYTLLRLKLANPDRLHLVRGNHEDINLVSRYGFMQEGRAKYGRNFDHAKILRAYDFLPVALYLGSGTDFIQLCHGGMEPGFQPAALLAAPGTNQFQLLGPLKQKTFLAQNPNWLKSDPASANTARSLFEDFVPTAPTQPTILGFMWNDFTVFGDEAPFANNPERAYVYGQPAVSYLLKNAGGQNATVHAVIRAHQHSSAPNPLMRRLVASRGAFRHWQEATSQGETLEVPALTNRVDTAATRTLPEGSVWTLNVTPDSVYGQGNRFSFATFTVLQLGSAFRDWRLQVETVEINGLR